MKFRYKIISFTLTIILLSSLTPQTSYAKNSPRINSHAAVVIDQMSGRVLYGKNENKILPMASTTKIVTALVAIEKGNLNDKVTISKKAASVKGSTAKFKEGETVSLEELIYGLMMKSGNDAAIAISEHIGNGKVEDFVDIMNKKALEIGLYNTHFVTPHGLDADAHQTTATDLAKATAYALKNKTFQKVSACKEITSGESGAFSKGYNNINKFLFKVPGSDGVKTGYTGKAGKCLVASVPNPHGRYIAVTLNSGDRWKDCQNLIEFAEENFEHTKIPTENIKLEPLGIVGTKNAFVNPKLENEIYIPTLKDKSENIETNIRLSSVVSAPVLKGDRLGNMVIKIDGKDIANFGIFSDKTVD